MRQKGFTPILILVIILIVAGVVFVMGQSLKSNPVSFTSSTENYPSATPFTNLPQPQVLGWSVYTDKTYGLFSFEYPDFMPEFTTSPSGFDLVNYNSSYIWQIDKLPSGDSIHMFSGEITGPYSDSTNKTVIEWLKEQNWPYKEGDHQESESGQIVKVLYKVIQGRQVVESTTYGHQQKYPFWKNLYFETDKGIYQLHLTNIGSDEEVANYQVIFDHVINTFKFIN